MDDIERWVAKLFRRHPKAIQAKPTDAPA